MNANPDEAPKNTTVPPRLIPSFASGFNAVANNIYLILLPLALDLLLWFGPHLRLKQLVLPFVLDTVKMVRETSTPEYRPMLEGIEQIWTLFLERYNLLSVLSTFPVGVPSLMSGQAPVNTPVGGVQVVEVDSLFNAFAIWLVAFLIGLVIGSLYFAFIARCCYPEPLNAIRPAVIGWQALQVLALVIILLVMILILALPGIFIASLLGLLSPLLASIALLGMSFIAIWLLVPLVFSPHGIFAYRQNVLVAMLTSARMVRFFLPGTGMFLLIAVVLYQGLGALWRTPPDTSWMALIGILGHAFISTALLASSFIYYRNGQNWVQSLRKQAQPS